MMKHIFFTGLMFLASAMTSPTMADCGGHGWKQVVNAANAKEKKNAKEKEKEKDQSLTDLLSGNTVCSSTDQGTQEEHLSNGELWDFKKGNGDATDPRIKVGGWLVTGTNGDTMVTYTYEAFGPPTQTGPFKVYQLGQTYDFCDASNTSVGTFTIVTGINVGC